MDFTRLRWFWAGCGPPPCSLIIWSWYFYSLKVHGLTTSNFFYWTISRFPLWKLEFQARQLRLRFFGDPRRAGSARPLCYFSHFLSTSQAFPGTLARVSYSLGDPLLRVMTTSKQKFAPGVLVWTVYVSSPSSFISLVVLVGMLKVLAELHRIDCPSVRISSDRCTGCVVKRSCWTPVLVLFDW